MQYAMDELNFVHCLRGQRIEISDICIQLHPLQETDSVRTEKNGSAGRNSNICIELPSEKKMLYS